MEFVSVLSRCYATAYKREPLRSAFAYLLCMTMQEYYESEDARQKAFVKVLNIYFPKKFSCSQKGDPHQYIYLDDKIYIEIKNEPGSTQCDPYPEATSYYIQGLTDNYHSPAFVVTLDGTYLTIYGAVYPNRLYIDMLTPPIWLVDQSNNTTAMERIARRRQLNSRLL